MTKEMKRPTSHISGNSIKPALSKAVEFYTDNNRQAYECIRERDEYIDYLEYELKQKDEHILKVENENLFMRDERTTFDSNGMAVEPKLQQQALPFVPECVAEFITKVKKADNNLTFAFNSKFDECPAKYWNEAIVWRLNNPDEFARAWLDGYTVEKPKLFYLREKNTNYYLNKSKNNGLELVPNPYFDEDNQFTKQEIDSMQTGSYELVPVEDEE